MAMKKPAPKVKPKAAAKPVAKASTPSKTRAKPSKPASSTKAKAGSPKGDSSPFHLESYLMGAAHGAKILFDHAKQQMGQEAQGYQKAAASIPGQVQDAVGQDMNAAFGPNGAIPVQRIQQGAQQAP